MVGLFFLQTSMKKAGCLGFQVLQMIFGDVYLIQPAPLKGTRASEADRDRGGGGNGELADELWVKPSILACYFDLFWKDAKVLDLFVCGF